MPTSGLFGRTPHLCEAATPLDHIMSLELTRVVSGPPKPRDDPAADCRRVPAQSGKRGTVIGALAAHAVNGHHPMEPECSIGTAGAGRRSVVPLPPFRLGLPGRGTPDPIVAMLGDRCASWQRAGVRERHLRPIPPGCPASVARGQPSLAQYGPADAGHLRHEVPCQAMRPVGSFDNALSS